MSDLKWTNDETFEFIAMYQNEPVLWDPKHKYHKDKTAVSDAWKRISDAMSASVPELKRKKEILLVTFRLNHKKVQASIRSGAEEDEIFKPIWIYYNALAAFMGDVYECKNILTTEKVLRESPSIKGEPSDDENQEHDIKSVQYSIETPVQKRCRDPLELEDTQTQMNTALSSLNKAKNNIKQNEREDECDLYGRLLALKLKSYSELERQELMYEIDGLLLKKRKRLLE